jgi:hypothetical protein
MKEKKRKLNKYIYNYAFQILNLKKENKNKNYFK